ncbi:DUF4271 domain-containing protein [Aridibaculum aurantiacum]|uniref:DUF4271 domain-containing protein n=1 Tax=Aridibaculum aurantiacum TaxID=2810307 RepID=UPI001A9616C2|nr:DUF4271 domain-containing protein [Aridibaculum aurantiacum]
MKYLLLIIFFSLFGSAVFAQADTGAVPPPVGAPAVRQTSPAANPLPQSGQIDTANDTAVAAAPDTVSVKQLPVARPVDSLFLKLLDNPYLQMTEPPVYLVIKEREREDKDEMFYLLAGLLLLLAFIKLVFPRYFTNVFHLFFQPSFRQKQTREHLLQSALPSLLLNLFFILSGGAYLALLVDHYNVVDESFWLLFLNGTLFLTILYTGKYVFLTFAGWVFNVKQSAETYIFIVYLINKIIGVVLLPITLVIAFSQPIVIDVGITVSVVVISLLFFYRYVLAFGQVRREVKVNLLHFFFYVLAFEITPLLLIYKTLMIYLDKSL